MTTINVLSQNMVNKIAAGEVVERPASAVKEMMENSMDAGATRVAVEVEDGGKKLIRVSDNGCGMDADDVVLAFAPHATSKIITDDDLFAIETLGFRGEALASIASVSQVDIVSRPSDAIEGARLEISAGKQSPVTPASSSCGTTITIRNLFFNTPARRKFLRTANTEMGHIIEQFTRIALAHTETHLSLTHNGRTIHDLPAGQTLQQRIGTLFSSELADALFPVNRKERDIEITGLVAHPQQSRTGAQWQYVFLNGRHIRDRFIGHAIREAYRGMVEINRRPVVFLFLRMPPADVDVNVHPAKTEVRFSNSNMVHSQVLAAIRDRLLSSDLTMPLRGGDLAGPPAGPSSSQGTDADSSGNEPEHQERVRQAMADFFKSSASRQTTANNRPPGHIPARAVPAQGAFSKPPDSLSHSGAPVTDDASPMETPESLPPASAGPTPTAGQYTDRHIEDERAYTDEIGPVLQIHNTYIVTETEDGFVIIDQHALHERILYEELSSQLDKGPLAAQRRLIPEVVDVTAEQIAGVENHTELLAGMGITIEQFGPRSIAVQSFPVLLDKADPSEFVRDLLDLFLERAGNLSREELIHHVLDMMACKAAVKAGDPLSDAEIRALLAQRRLIQQSGTCPHGRPTTIRLSLAELEKQFKRT
jgi:DNA mismatch repair protein MutL